MMSDRKRKPSKYPKVVDIRKYKNQQKTEKRISEWKVRILEKAEFVETLIPSKEPDG